MQTTVESAMTIGLPGQLADLANNDIVSRVNGSKETHLITVTAANLATTLTVNSTGFTVNVGAATLTVAALGALLVAAINAGSEPVTATDLEDGTFYVRADVHGTAFTTTGTTNCSTATVIENEDTIEFGKFVTEDTWTGLNDAAHLPLSAAEITDAKLGVGVTVHTQALEQAASGSTNVGYAAYSSMSVIRKGRVYVGVEDAVTKGGGVYVRYTASGSYTIGSFRSDEDSGKAALLPGARYARAAAAGGIAILELNNP